MKLSQSVLLPLFKTDLLFFSLLSLLDTQPKTDKMQQETKDKVPSAGESKGEGQWEQLLGSGTGVGVKKTRDIINSG